MKKLLIGVMLLGSMSSYATIDLNHGGKVIIKLDPTIMFEDSEDKAVIGIDWSRVLYVLTNGIAKFERSFCAQQLAGAYISIENVEKLKGAISEDEYLIHRNLANKLLQGQFDTCVAQLGIKDAKNLNETVLNEMGIKH